MEDVGDRDRLAGGVDPARRDHDRQPLDQVAQDLEGGAARTDDHRRPEDGHRHGAALQDLPDLVARAQVVAEPRGLLAEPAKVDDPLDAGGGRGGRHVLRRLPVGGGEVGGLRIHGVHEVKGRLASPQRRFEAGRSKTSPAAISTSGAPAHGRPASLAGLRPMARTRQPAFARRGTRRAPM